ncbi:hypothetical protein HCA60_02010 [Listeria booriae]|uniref:hypothetical protein n=1 Tax=Listeria booriae TaxID=1552123 RepID=UPI001624B69B|nr:hypothetical protein [Listeria booriae]MBC1811260.1 hypothetical protein [Listeria booriae]
MVKNYLEHEIKVKYIDGVLGKSSDWQWFITYIEETYDICEIDSMESFWLQYRNTYEIYSYFIKILETGIRDMKFKNPIVEEFFFIAQFFMGKLSLEKAVDLVESLNAKIFLLFIWITKLENQSNSSEYIIDTRLFLKHNIFKIIDVESLKLEEERVVEYLKIIDIDGFEQIKKCLLDNIQELAYPVSIEIFKQNTNTIISANAFNRTFIELPSDVSWEEEYILDMLKISIRNHEIVPVSEFNGISNPDTSLWTEDIIRELQEFFHDEITDFVLETIAYVTYRKEMSENVMLEHVRLMIGVIVSANEKINQLRCSSFEIISYLFEDKKINKISRKAMYIEMIKEFQKIKEPQIIGLLQKNKIPLSREQKEALKQFYDEQYKIINQVSESSGLMNYFENKNAVRTITTNYFKKVSSKFNEFITHDDGIMLASLFYMYMCFLLRLKNGSATIDKQLLNFEMIRIQNLWEKDYYYRCTDALHLFENKFEIPKKWVEDYNENVLNNILSISRYCIICKEADLVESMKSISENPLAHMATKIHFSEVFPIQELEQENYNRHEIDATLQEIVQNIIEVKGYKFINYVEVATYVKEIHRSSINKTFTFIGMFHEEKNLYEELQNKITDYSLQPYSENLVLGHVTQLFPILEKQIRELATMLNIFPYKESENEFMLCKDPSSILREILLEVYEELGNYENVGDILFVYNFMYNSNSLNIRNECIHGRKYTQGSELQFAFKVTLCALAIIIKRIEIIKDSTGD